MNLFIYSDESGVFDHLHNDYYVFGGLIFFEKEHRDIWTRKYSAAEKSIRKIEGFPDGIELKATTISNKSKNKLFRSLNQVDKFAVAIHQKKISNKIFDHKKTKQRYLDYAFKIGIKRKLQQLIRNGNIIAKEVERLYFFIDEHTTATNGRYELREGLEQEFKIGTYNQDYSCFFYPIFPCLKSLDVVFCDSASNLLIRAADIVANQTYWAVINNKISEKLDEHFYCTMLPY